MLGIPSIHRPLAGDLDFAVGEGVEQHASFATWRRETPNTDCRAECGDSSRTRVGMALDPVLPVAVDGVSMMDLLGRKSESVFA